MPYPGREQLRLGYWQRQVDYACRRVRPFFEAAQVLVRQYENEATTEREKSRESSDIEPHISRLKANLVFGWIDQEIANLLERNPSFIVTALQRNSTAGAPVAQAVANYWYRETNQLRHDERLLLDAFLCPYGVKKLGWTADIESRIQEIIGVNPEYDFADDWETDLNFLLTGVETMVTPEQDHQLHLQMKQQALQNPNLAPDIQGVLEENIRQHRKYLDRASTPEADTTIQYEAPYGVRWNPEDFVVDPLAEHGLQDARWIAFRWRRPVDEVKANPNYENTQRLEPSSRPDGAPSADPIFDNDGLGLVVGWEVWAKDVIMEGYKRRNLLVCFAEGHDKLLRHEDEWPYTNLDDYPAEVLSFQQTIGNWFTKPTLSMAGADNVQALANEILDSYLSTIRKQKNIILYDPDIVEEDEMDNLLIAPDMSAIPVRGLREARENPVRSVIFGNVPGDKGELLSMIINLFDRAAGTPQPITQPRTDTATEASIYERRTSAREARRSMLLAEMQVRTIRKFWQLTCQYLPNRAFLIHPQANEWAAVDEEIARGEYRFRIDVASYAQALSIERKNWADLLNLFAGLSGLFQQLTGQAPNLAKLAERLLTRGYNEQAPEEILPMLANGGQTVPPEQQAAMIQMLMGTPGQPPPQPGMTSAPMEVERENRTGPAMPNMYRQPPAEQGKTAGRALR